MLLSILPLCGMAQSRVQYTYDNAGNRLTQAVVYDEPDRSSKGDSRNGNTLTREVAGHTVSVTVSPETGEVCVEVLGLGDDDDCRLSVYALSGICVLSQPLTDTRTTLDLGGNREDIYILLLRLNGTSASWKITMK